MPWLTYDQTGERRAVSGLFGAEAIFEHAAAPAGAAMSARVQCINATVAQVLSYATIDCTGTPLERYFSSLTCQNFGSVTSSISCFTGPGSAYTPPPGLAQRVDPIDACPGVDANVDQVHSYVTNKCFEGPSSSYGLVTCSTASGMGVLETFYTSSCVFLARTRQLREPSPPPLSPSALAKAPQTTHKMSHSAASRLVPMRPQTRSPARALLPLHPCIRCQRHDS